MQFQTYYKRDESVRFEEISDLASETIPDQSMTVQEILSRHARGLGYDGPRVALYQGGDELDPDADYIPDPATMDLADRQAYKEEATEELNEIKARQQAKKKKAKPDTTPTPPKPPLEQEVIPFEEVPDPKK